MISGGKQYRVTAGDHVLVDRLQAEPGSSVKLGRVLLLRAGDEVTVGLPGVEGAEVEAKVLAHRRGPRIEVLRYKSKKRVRVHRGGRADLTAIEILTVGNPAKPKPKQEEAEPDEDEKAAPKRPARKPRAAKAAAKTTKENK